MTPELWHCLFMIVGFILTAIMHRITGVLPGPAPTDPEKPSVNPLAGPLARPSVNPIISEAEAQLVALVRMALAKHQQQTIQDVLRGLVDSPVSPMPQMQNGATKTP